MKLYITFGQRHSHEINGKVFDRDCIAVIEAPTSEMCDRLRQEHFGKLYARAWFEHDFDMDDIKYYHRGLMEV